MSWLAPTLLLSLLFLSVYHSVLCLSADCVSQCHLVDSHPARTPLRPAMQKLQRGSPRDVAVSQDILKVQHCECDKSVCVCVSVSGRGWDGWMDGQGRSYLVRSSVLSWCGWWWGWSVEKPPQSSPEWCPWWTAARWPDPAGSTYTNKHTHTNTHSENPDTDLDILLSNGCTIWSKQLAKVTYF